MSERDLLLDQALVAATSSFVNQHGSQCLRDGLDAGVFKEIRDWSSRSGLANKEYRRDQFIEARGVWGTCGYCPRKLFSQEKQPQKCSDWKRPDHQLKPLHLTVSSMLDKGEATLEFGSHLRQALASIK